MSESTSSKLKQQFVRPIGVGLVSALGARAMGVQFRITMPLLGNVSKPVFYGVLGFGSSLVSETLHQWVLPYLPQSEEAVNAENAVLSPALHALTNVVALKVIYPGILEDHGLQEPILIGAGAEVLGDYGFKYWVQPMDWMKD
jgi:hypothetical protein